MGQFFTKPPGYDETGGQNQVSWWMRSLARGLGTGCGLLAVILGLVAAFSIYPSCIFAGLLLMFFGLVVLLLEAHCLCPFVTFIGRVANFSDNRAHWQKAAIYVVLGVIPLCICQGLTLIFGCLSLMVVGAFYGMFALGKKADRGEMMARAGGGNIPNNPDGMRNDLVDTEKQPSTGQYP